MQVLKLAIERGIAETQPLQTQMAIWYEIEGNWSYEEATINRDMAQLLVNEAQNASLTPLEPEGIRLDQAVANGTITITSEDFRFVEAPRARPDDQPYLGRGTLVLKNNTAQDVTVYYPFGLVLSSPTRMSRIW